MNLTFPKKVTFIREYEINLDPEEVLENKVFLMSK